VPAPTKPKKPGRPKLPKGNAKAETLCIRLTLDELRIIEAAAKAKKQSVSEGIGNRLNTPIID
jgi:hypothetical protein